MKKKYLSTLLLGLLVIGTTGTVTSCKDYDDDINGLETRLATVESALTQCKTDCENARNTLKAQLEQKDAELTTLIQTAQSTAEQAKTAAAAAQSTADKAVKDAEAAAQAAANEVSRAIAAEANLEARIKTCEDAISEINTVLAGKVDKTSFDATVTDIYGKLESVQTSLGEALTKISNAEGEIATLKSGLENEKTARVAAANDLQQQINTLKGYEDRISKLETAVKGYVTSSDLDTKLADLKKGLEDKIAALNVQSIDGLTEALAAKADADKVYTKTEINNLLQAQSDKLDALQSELNALNVLIKQSLRSLVFRPDLYYWGVEGTKLLTLDAKKYELPKTDYKTVESNYNDKHEIYKSSDIFRILSFTANYHMNPSSADKSSFKDVKVLSDDKEFIHTRAAACGLSVSNWDVKDGMLQVDLNVSNKNAIKRVPADSMITVFATQVTIAKGSADTTITSDYATLVKDEAKNLYIFHKKGSSIPYYNVENNHCGKCAVSNAATKGLGHLFETTWEASKDYTPQDSCNWNDTLDLRKLVETHYVDVDGVEKVFDAEKYGLSYKFELTGLYLEGNKTSESAHAAISPTDGYTFRPQMPNYDKDNVGTQQPYGYSQGRQTIGRTPLVRVSLVDTDGNVLAYGYIRIKITEPSKVAPQQKDLYISYTGKDYTYNEECTLPSWSYETKWIQTEYDLYSMLGLTREEFEAYYTPDYKSSNIFKQYILKTAGTAKVIENPETEQNITYYEDGVFAAATEDYGTVTHIADASLTEDGTRTSIIRWNMTGADAYKIFSANKNGAVRAVKYESNKSGYPDVYVVLNTGKATFNKPSATVKWTDAIISNYWYATNGNEGKSGTDEIHANVYTPEDAPTAGKTIADFDDMFSDVFMGNFTTAPSTWAKMLDITDYTTAKEFAANNLTVNFVFSSKNTGKQFKGLSGTTYTLGLKDNGKTLTATAGSVTKEIAKIEGNSYLTQKAVLQETDFAKDLLNASAHNDLAGTESGNGKALEAIIGISAVNKCNKELPISENTFNVRFLRPLNVKSADDKIQDANIETLQVINVVDLVLFNDWRDSWNHKSDVWGKYADGNAEYAKYYGIKSIKIDGVADGDRISNNTQVKTSLGAADVNNFDKSLKSVSDQLDFTYNEGKDANGNYDLTKSTLTYRNLSSTLSTCKVQIPVTVEYYWGTLKAVAVITIDATAHNAKRK